MTTSVYLDGAILLKVASSMSSMPIKFYPEEIHNDPQIETILTNSLAKFNDEMIFCYTLDHRIAFAYSFCVNEENYSISLITKFKYPKLFITFFEEMSSHFKESETPMSPEDMFDLMINTFPSWSNFQFERLDEMEFTRRYAHLKTPDQYFADFDPYDHFTSFESINKAWKALFLGTGLLIVANGPEHLIDAAFSAMSIISPFNFEGELFISACEFDWRLDDMAKYELVVVLPGAIKYLKRKFNVALKHSPVGADFSGSRMRLLERTKKMDDILTYLMDRVLSLNPFNDMLEGPYVNDSLEQEMNPKHQKTALQPDQFRIVEQTITIRKWRESIQFRDTFRDNFLSCVPKRVIDALSLDHVKKLPIFLDKIDERFKEDSHMHAVVKQYRKEIQSVLEAFK